MIQDILLSILKKIIAIELYYIHIYIHAYMVIRERRRRRKKKEETYNRQNIFKKFITVVIVITLSINNI